MSSETVRPQFCLTARWLKTEVGCLAYGAVGIAIYLYKSQFSLTLNLMFWKVELYWVFRKFEPSTLPAGYVVTNVNGVNFADMTRDELVSTATSLATFLHKQGRGR